MHLPRQWTSSRQTTSLSQLARCWLTRSLPPDVFALTQGDFIVIMKTLQHYPPVDINVILQKAAALTPCADIPGFNF